MCPEFIDLEINNQPTMSRSIHPPCTPSASCSPVRCHPPPPPCKNPERCLKRTTSKGVRPCQSAVSIMATRSKARCGSCSKIKSKNNSNDDAVEKYLKRKSREARMKKKDRLKGTHSYEDYSKRRGSVSKEECCLGKGHRGRLKKKRFCQIL